MFLYTTVPKCMRTLRAARKGLSWPRLCLPLCGLTRACNISRLARPQLSTHKSVWLPCEQKPTFLGLLSLAAIGQGLKTQHPFTMHNYNTLNCSVAESQLIMQLCFTWILSCATTAFLALFTCNARKYSTDIQFIMSLSHAHHTTLQHPCGVLTGP
jgi:hypothetical protein